MSDWDIREFQSIAHIKRGRFSPRPRNDPQYYGGDIPFVQTGDVTRAGNYIKEYRQTLNEKGLSVSKVFPKNTILMTIAANIGDVAILNFDSACTDSLVAFQPKDGIDNQWLFHVLKTMKNKFVGLSTQNAQKNLSIEKIKPVKIIVPPLPEQKAIADLLSTWDTAIEKTEALITAKQQQFDWLVKWLLNEQKQHTKRLGESFAKDITIEKGKPLVKNNIVEGNIPVIAGGKTSPYSNSQHTHTIPCITVSGSGASAGFVWYHNYPIWASDCNVIYSEKHSTEYLYFALKSKQEMIYSFQSGGGQPHIYARDINNVSIPLPPFSEQKRIAKILNTAKQEIDSLKSLAKQYRTQKRGLMQKLLTGKWRIKL